MKHHILKHHILELPSIMKELVPLTEDPDRVWPICTQDLSTNNVRKA